MHIINDSVAIVVSHQSVRTVYHHALPCIKKRFRNDDIQNFALMICNSCGIGDIQCFALISDETAPDCNFISDMI